ncbi:MAG: hypothetical protein KatS3mg103_0081 [Phycisphaerales bacterium]|nr:MAG: hypothetical protein KatS3mg103_0081 [Phycisphaerales bacterium]
MGAWDAPTGADQPPAQSVEPGWFLVPIQQAGDDRVAKALEAVAARWPDAPAHTLQAPLAVLTCPARSAKDPARPPRRITAERIIDRRDPPRLNGHASAWLQWLDDQRLLKIMPDDEPHDGQAVVVDARTGRVLEAAPVGPWEDAARSLAALDGIDARDARRLARGGLGRPGTTREQPWIFEHEGDLYALWPDGSRAVRLTRTPDRREEVWSLSPDATMVAYVQDNDLWVVDLDTATPRPLTTGGSDTLRHGKASWVYYEELFDRNWQAYRWSPDSRTIALLITDSTPVPTHTIVDLQDHDPAILVEHYPRPGDPNPIVELALVSPTGGPLRRIDLDGYDPADRLISHIAWSPDGSNCIVHVQNRTQTWLDVLAVPAAGGSPTRLLRDATDAWITSPKDATYLRDGSFLLFSERTGYRHLDRYAPDGTRLNAVTTGPWDVQDLLAIDPDENWAYLLVRGMTPISTDLVKARLDGSATVRLTHEPGSHSVRLNPSATMFIDAWSTLHAPQRMALRSTEDGSLIRWLDTNPADHLQDERLARLEHVSIPTDRPGVSLEAIVHYPPGFDPAGRYPLWVMTYAGPGAPTVRNAWQGGRPWEQLLCSAGIVVLRVDPYAASGKGAQSAWTSYKNLGVGELADLEQAVRWAFEQGWADPARVGISGHSYGGYITCYALAHSDLFTAGIAGAPVTDWRLYDTIYTERYMDTPQANPKGYERSSVLSGARNLKGRLLIAHGQIDDNVHPAQHHAPGRRAATGRHRLRDGHLPRQPPRHRLTPVPTPPVGLHPTHDGTPAPGRSRRGGIRRRAPTIRPTPPPSDRPSRPVRAPALGLGEPAAADLSCVGRRVGALRAASQAGTGSTARPPIRGQQRAATRNGGIRAWTTSRANWCSWPSPPRAWR